MSSGDAIQRILERARQELLDLSARNRLISTPRDSTRSKRLEIVGERSDDIFRLLVRDRKAVSFLPSRSKETEAPDASGVEGVPALFQPDDNDVAETAQDPQRYTDLRLQTKLNSDRLQSRLLDLYCDARTYEEEQGVSILYLALGFLKWYESPSSDKARYAPLLLIPVDLERLSAVSRFKLSLRDEEIATNLSLQAKLDKEFNVALPDVPDSEEFSPATYFEGVAKAVRAQARWEVLQDDIVLWFFSFAKFLMYRDLIPENWPKHCPLDKGKLLMGVLQDGFQNDPPLCGEDEKIDDLILPQDMVHVTDADSSQTVVIEEARRGRNLVVQGPPGTGKSQTITNVIASAVKEGKRVLFVAEKMAALDVVKSRLDRLGLGALCLELHSHKSNKKSVLEELGRTLALGRPKGMGMSGTTESLQAVRSRLNQHATLMNSPHGKSELTPFQLLGRLVRLYADGAEPADFALPDAFQWTRAEFHERLALLEDLQLHLRNIGVPRDHPWRGVHLEAPPLPTDIRQALVKVGEIEKWISDVAEGVQALSVALHVREQESITFRAVQRLLQLARKLLSAPTMDRKQLAHDAWESQTRAIDDLVAKGRTLDSCREKLKNVVTDLA